MLYLELQTNVHFVGQPKLHLVNQTHFSKVCERLELGKTEFKLGDPGDLYIKHYFETGLGSRHALVIYNVSCVTYHMSRVTCHLSPVTCHMLFIAKLQICQTPKFSH